jgi:hypothetical protein
MLYVKKEKLDSIKVSEKNYCIKYPPMSLVHPEVYLWKTKNNDCYQISLFRLYKITIKRTIKKILGQRLINMIKNIKRSQNV